MTPPAGYQAPLPTGKIEPQPWIIAGETRAVIEALTAEGQVVRFVGGCVRDALAKRPVKDVDIATPDPPEKVMALLEAAKIKAIPTGIDHGTVTAVVNKKPFEITTLRIDVDTDGRRAKVAFTDDWIADASRRDFTINTLSATPEGDVYDPFGGLDDLALGVVRFVGVAGERIAEDRLRILRFFRFNAEFGRPPADTDALVACRNQAAGLSELSGERIRTELFRILLAPEPADAVRLMQGHDVLAVILPEAGDVGPLRMLSWLETKAIKVESVVPDQVRRLAALLNTDVAGAGEVAERLRLSNKEKARLIRAVEIPEGFGPELAERELRKLLHHNGAANVRDWGLLAWAGELAITPRQSEEVRGRWLSLLVAADGWRPVAFPLQGRDAEGLGIEAGPRMGELLNAIEAWWEEEDFRPDHAACLDKLKEYAG